MIIHFEMFGEEVLARELLRFGEKALAPEPAFKAIIESMQSDTEEQFSSEGGAQSGGWAPLAPSTIANKARLKLRPEILRATDRMMNSFQGGSDGFERIMPTGFEWGTNVEYAIFHQTGTSRMPQRRPVDFTEAQKQKYVKIIQRYIVEAP